MEEKQGEVKVKWYLKPVSIVIAVLGLGPFAIPLVLMSPALRKWQKVALTAFLVLFTVWFVKAAMDIYRSLLKQMQDIQGMMK